MFEKMEAQCSKEGYICIWQITVAIVSEKSHRYRFIDFLVINYIFKSQHIFIYRLGAILKSR